MNKIILLITASVFTTLACFFPLFLIPLCIVVVLFFLLIFLDFLKDTHLDKKDLTDVTKRISDLEEKFNKSSLKLLNK